MEGGKGEGGRQADKTEGGDMRSRYRHEAMHNIGIRVCK